MEIFELRYFLTVAQTENVHKASAIMNVSTGSLSKAITRLEIELGLPLFYKQGRNIRLTAEGHVLKKRANQILQLEEDAKIELQGPKGSLNVILAAEEILHSHFGLPLAEKIQKLFPFSRFQFLTSNEATLGQQVTDGEVHFGLLTGELPHGLKAKTLAKAEFRTCASANHPLFKKYSHGSKIPITEVLAFPFVSPESTMLGKIMTSTSLDGWRDDKFPRQIKFRASGLKVIEDLVLQGHALAYLPDYHIKSLGLIALNVVGCAYSCHQTVRLLCKDPAALGWLNRVWDSI